MVVTTINTLDNLRTFEGNDKILSDNIQNFTANPYRRVEVTVQVAHSKDPRAAMEKIASQVARIPNITSMPAPDLKMLAVTPAGCTIAVRPYCHNH